MFSDLLYGRIELPDWLGRFLRIPEFVRLRSIRLSNVDSIEFKDFGSATRWEHGIAVAYLAWRCGKHRRLPINRHAELVLAALLHDVATPPFAHTAEYVLDGFDHELETQRVLSALASDSSSPDMPVLGSSLPQFQRAVRALAQEDGIRVDADEVARMVTGEGELGFLISGTVDLDNADNITRGCAQMGINVDPHIPLRISEWLAEQQCAPTDLDSQVEPAVSAWLDYRSRYYSAFFEASEQELGRQAFLQHLMRRALSSGFPRRALVWSTDEGLLSAIARVEIDNPPRSHPALSELVDRYRLMEPTHRSFELDLENEVILRIFRAGATVSWLEDHLSSPQLELMLIVSSRRFPRKDDRHLFAPPSPGFLIGFKLGGQVQHRHLPEWLQSRISPSLIGKQLQNAIACSIRTEIPNWVKTRPWVSMTERRRESVLESLRSAGDWSFRLSRNENMHAYPSTFVHAIPAALINCLGLHEEIILDPFGGTGQTAVEAVKYECNAISADSNTIATLIARARLTPLSTRQRGHIRELSADDLRATLPCDPPEFESRGKWHHPKTLRELCRIWAFIQSMKDRDIRQFLTACFSAIIPATTARRGKEHGFFADNTPLPANLEKPPYVDALDLFLTRKKKNLEILSSLYAFMERTERDPQTELSKARVIQLDACTASCEDYGVDAGSVGGIITSPPYLCMADYTLGQRLSYYWIAPSAFKADFDKEVGARRLRFRTKAALDAYFSSLEKFAQNSAKLLRSGGFLATVLGNPVAERFKGVRVLDRVDRIYREAGFELLWNHSRRINWHRNQGYQRLLRERVSVHVLQ